MRTHNVTGLDIEPTYMAAAEVDGGLAVTKAATTTMAPDVMRDGEVTDADALGERLKDFFAQHRLPKRVRIGVANQQIVVRTLDLPRLDNAKDLDAAVRFQAQEHVPMPLERAVLDYRPLDIVEIDGNERQRVLVVAARRDMIERLLAATRTAGLRLEGIDLSAFAMIRSLQTAATTDTGAVLYIQVGGLTNVAVAQGTACTFTRVVGAGLEGMVGDLAQRRGLTLEHSRGWLGHVGLSAPVDGIDGDPAIVSDARTVLADGAQRIADEVRHSLDFYRASEHSKPVQRAVLTGPALSIPGFAEQLAADLNLPVTPGLVERAPGSALGDLDLSRFAVAAGLAVEERTS